MNKMAVYLNQHINGVAYSSPDVLEQYSTDRSLLHYQPKLVALPADVTDVRRLVKFSAQLSAKGLELPIAVRGAGYGKNGGCLTTGLVVSMEKLNHIQEIDVRQRLIRVQAGVTLGELQKTLALSGLELPIYGDPLETIGGLVAQCVSASNNTEPSTIVDFIERAEVVLADGSLAQFGAESLSKIRKKATEKTFEGKIYTKLLKLLDENSKLIEQIPSQKESRANYSGLANLERKRKFNLVPLLCGSEGSLGIITEVILRCEPIFEDPNYVAVTCDNAAAFVQNVKILKDLKFTDIIFYDTEIFADSQLTGKASKFFRKPSRDGYLLVANAKDDSRLARRRKISALKKKLPASARLIICDKENRRDFAALEESLLAYLGASPRGVRVPIIDNVYIPADRQAEYLDGVTALAEELSRQLAVFGSADYDLFSVRPVFMPAAKNNYQSLVDFLRRYTKLVEDCGGQTCGGAAGGRFISAFIKSQSSPELRAFYGKIKECFDPQGIFNPGIKQDVDARVVFRHLRSEYDLTPQSAH